MQCGSSSSNSSSTYPNQVKFLEAKINVLEKQQSCSRRPLSCINGGIHFSKASFFKKKCRHRVWKQNARLMRCQTCDKRDEERKDFIIIPLHEYISMVEQQKFSSNPSFTVYYYRFLWYSSTELLYFLSHEKPGSSS